MPALWRCIILTRKKLNKPGRRLPNNKRAWASKLTKKFAKTVLAPLGRKESATAINLALEQVLRDGAIQRERVRIYGPYLRIEKPKRRDGAPVRMICVRVRDRDQHIVHEVTINAEKAIEHKIAPNANPPFSDEEQADARELISKDPKLGKLSSRKSVGIEWFSPGGHGQSRMIGARLVRVQANRVIEVLMEVEVDLDEGILHEGRGHQ